MRHLSKSAGGICAGVCLLASLAHGDPSVQTTDISVNGNAIGFNAGPHLKHFLVLAAKGSRLMLYIDGQAGPKVESMEWTGGALFNTNGD